MKWRSEYETGLPAIDKQHQEFFLRLDNLSTTVFTAPADTEKALNFLSEYVELHFGMEERLMESTHYPAIQDHLRLHRQFRADVEEFRRFILSEGFSSGLAGAMVNFLWEWFERHILNVDFKLGKFLLQQRTIPHPPAMGSPDSSASVA